MEVPINRPKGSIIVPPGFRKLPAPAVVEPLFPPHGGEYGEQREQETRSADDG